MLSSALLAATAAALVLTGPATAADPRIVLAGLPCTKLLAVYGTPQIQSFLPSIVQNVSDMDRGGVLGSSANIADYVLTECRLNEGSTVGEVVLALFDAARFHNLPAIPIGGATNDPKVRAEWNAYDKWLKHKGPQPHYAH
jgi:hypothetical protein